MVQSITQISSNPLRVDFTAKKRGIGNFAVAECYADETKLKGLDQFAPQVRRQRLFFHLNQEKLTSVQSKDGAAAKKSILKAFQKYEAPLPDELINVFKQTKWASALVTRLDASE